MYFALTEDQRDFGSAVRDFLIGEVRHRSRARGGRGRNVSRRGRQRASRRAVAGDGGSRGWLAVLVPEEHDGLGLGLVDAQVIARELGAGGGAGVRGGAPCWPPRRFGLAGSASQQREWLPRLAAGRGGSVRWPWRGSTEQGWPAVEYAEVADALVVADGAGLRLLRRDEG